MTTQLSSGTVTFLLTDLEGSTRMWEEDPVAMKAAMVRHDEIWRRRSRPIAVLSSREWATAMRTDEAISYTLTNIDPRHLT
jgi:hypothetical protein